MKTIGIIGGIGPLATADLFRKIILLTDAKCDQEHIHILIDNNPSIPDRTAAILSGGQDPVDELIKTAKRLEAMGADFLLMPCNTAHYFYDRITAKIGVPLLNMIEEAADEAASLGLSRVGILATNGTIRTGLHCNALKKRGIEPLHPSEKGQKSVMGLIYDGVKANNLSYGLSGFYEALSELTDNGAEAFLLGCTELPIAFSMYNIPGQVLDPTEILAKRAVVFAGAGLKPPA